MDAEHDHSLSQERHHRHGNERHGEGRSNNYDSHSSTMDSERQQQRGERRSERSRAQGSLSPSSRPRRSPRVEDEVESRSAVSSSPEIPRQQLHQQLQQQEQEQQEDQNRHQQQQQQHELQQQQVSNQEQHPTPLDPNETSAIRKEPVMDKPLEEPQQATNVQSTEAKAASSDSILKPHSLSSSSTMNQLDRHRSKHASQEQHKVTEAKEDAKIEELKATIRDLERQEQEIMSAIRGEGTPTEIINRRIDQLHKYNEIKDVGQIVLGKCAEIEGTTVKKQYENYGLNLDD